MEIKIINYINCNIEISKFMGYELITRNEFNKNYNEIYKKYGDRSQFAIIEFQQYHKSWSWLMEVVEKIENCTFKWKNFDTKIDAVFQLISNFVNYLNKVDTDGI